MTVLKTFCCGLSLKHGTIIIGIVQSIGAFMFMILSATYADHPNEIFEVIDREMLPKVDMLRINLILISVASALLCSFSILLIFGAETNRPLLLLPWLIFDPLAIVLHILCTIISIVYYPGVYNFGFIIWHFVITASLCSMCGYMIVVVYSFFKYLRSLNF